MSTDSRPVSVYFVPVGIAFALILFLFLAQRSFVYTPDDAFITYRYSRNLAEGFGPVFNRFAPAADRSEGFSCPLFMILMAFLLKLPLGLDLLLKAKFFGLACGIGILFAVPKLAAKLGLPIWAQAALPVLLAAHAGISINSLDGMETAFAALLTTLAALLFLTAFDGESEKDPLRQKKYALLSGLAFAGCALNRPEALLMGLFALGALLMSRRGKLGADGIRWTMAFLLPVAIWFLFRRLYFGLWLPNTYYAKAAPIDFDLFFKGFTYLLRTFFYFLNDNLLLEAIGAAWWLLAIVGVSGERFRRFPALVVPLMAATQIVFVLRSGGDWMGGWRYMIPALPLLMLLAVAGIAEIEALLQTVGGKIIGHLWSGAACTAVLVVCLVGQQGFLEQGKEDGYQSWASKNFSLKQHDLLKGWRLERTVLMGEWLNANIPANSVIAYSEMGVTPFLCPQIRFLDVDGLTDHDVATLPGVKHGQIGVDSSGYMDGDNLIGKYLKDIRKPDYVLFGSTDAPPLDLLSGTYTLCGQFPVPMAAGEPNAIVGVWKRR